MQSKWHPGLHHDHQSSKMWSCRASGQTLRRIGMTMTHWKTNLPAAKSVCYTVSLHNALTKGAGRDQNWQLSLRPLKLHYYFLAHFLMKVEAGESYYHYGQPRNLCWQCKYRTSTTSWSSRYLWSANTVERDNIILRLMLSRHAVHADAAWGETHTNAMSRVSVHQSSSHTCPVLYTHADAIWATAGVRVKLLACSQSFICDAISTQPIEMAMNILMKTC